MRIFKTKKTIEHSGGITPQGTIFNEEGYYIDEWKEQEMNLNIRVLMTLKWESFNEFFEEINSKPKYKVWDYAVLEAPRGITYIKIDKILIEDNEIKYCPSVYNTYYSEESLRKPTREEYNTYFR